jgi:hypothetical protein
MALRKIIEAEGKSIVQTTYGSIENGTQRVSFSAYVKVVGISGDKEKVSANILFKGDACEFNKQYQVPVSVQDNALNFIAQIYQYLKTLPEFAGAEDC